MLQTFFSARLDPRYLVVFGACLTQFTIIGLLLSYGLFFKTFEAEFGWSRTLLSSGSALAFLVMGLFAAFGGRLNDNYGPRRVLAFTGLISSLGFILLSNMSHAWELVLIFGFFIGAGMSTHDVVTLSTIARCFQKRRGIMTGVVKVGTALGQVTIPPIVALLLVAYGWRPTFMIMGFTGLILLLIAAWAIGVNASQVRSEKDKVNSGFSFSEARKSRIFWLFCAIEFLFLPSLATVPFHIVVHGMDLGLTATVAATLVSTMAAASIIARLAVGSLFDRVGGKWTFASCLIMLLASLIALIFIKTPNPLFAAMIVYGFAHGGLFTVVSPAVAEYFGVKAHGALFGSILFFGTISGSIAPIFAGYIFDTTGSYTNAFHVLLAMAFIGLCLTLCLPRKLPIRSDSVH